MNHLLGVRVTSIIKRYKLMMLFNKGTVHEENSPKKEDA